VPTACLEGGGGAPRLLLVALKIAPTRTDSLRVRKFTSFYVTQAPICQKLCADSNEAVSNALEGPEETQVAQLNTALPRLTFLYEALGSPGEAEVISSFSSQVLTLQHLLQALRFDNLPGYFPASA
jgi:hypothetical protein